MTRHIRVPLSDELYEQVRSRAERLDKDVSQLLGEHLSATFATDLSVDDTAVERERAAYLRLHTDLLEKYEGRFVAIHDRQVVDHDADKLVLVERIDTQYPQQFVLIRRVETEPEQTYRRIGIRWAAE